MLIPTLVDHVFGQVHKSRYEKETLNFMFLGSCLLKGVLEHMYDNAFRVGRLHCQELAIILLGTREQCGPVCF
jgi:hypothetical protein